jgi:hypothetical protein
MVHALQPEKPPPLLLSGRQVFKVRSISLERHVDEAGESALVMDILRGRGRWQWLILPFKRKDVRDS